MSVAGQFLAGVLLVSGAAAAWAAPALPVPQEFYFDSDATAAPIVVVQGEGEDLVQQLLKQRERGRKALEATAQLASVAIAQGRAELGDKLYREALAEAPVQSSMGRSVRWNYGWDLLRQGQALAALEQWQSAASTLRSNPVWIPPTYALALWRAGQQQEAVKWYAAAVRTEPGQWSDSSRYAQILPAWRDDERASLAEVQQAWAAAPPAWP
ncbi:TPA: tetratricopeptide repeat protein [Stenotrophomonas maltophilia]|uniref:tetratricopeptide repeat protein n=1 Tax=Stenotrophomonas sp. TaxID=69392 RepID=UPI0028A8E482|nr:tetratricopeptide repeat protein [Stenotrophomonas sp.]HDS0951531.1 tetratricopeptide repeat protein [Stenotrophomonas maltophilia]HDS1027998.1 tetratricopeptide repeat protein [Stenotrophomonas maltophilia]HDS1032230.1 tetratricopeptide repeat protein [Stenotrophomonas maltophilia]HDS1033058.1 tetratricopeptide repeat protein [Stenotrophomonas maltophilia]HDS1041097.1 tetratricopeptide repeat protein [Stenotrophomonas maltophilia]